MVEISMNRNASELKVANYNGNSKEKFSCPIAFKRFPAEVNFFREKDNQSYIGGKIIHSEFIGNKPKKMDLFPPKAFMVFEKIGEKEK